MAERIYCSTGTYEYVEISSRSQFAVVNFAKLEPFQMESNKIPFTDPISETLNGMIDYTKLELWRFSGLSTDTFFLENAITLTTLHQYSKRLVCT